MTQLMIDATVANIDPVTAFIDEQLEAMDCSMKVQMQIDVAVDEIFSNIANYAYPDQTGKAEIIVEALTDPRAVRITFKDQGMDFNPLEQPDPDVTASADKRKTGGLGIYIVKRSMSKVEYQRENGFNIFVITKNLD